MSKAKWWKYLYRAPDSHNHKFESGTHSRAVVCGETQSTMRVVKEGEERVTHCKNCGWISTVTKIVGPRPF